MTGYPGNDDGYPVPFLRYPTQTYYNVGQIGDKLNQ